MTSIEGYDEPSSDLPAVPSPYEGQHLRPLQHIKISAYWFATNFLWGAILLIMLPGELKTLAPAYRVPALSLMTALAAIVALVCPLVVGALSDRCASRMGRRRPYMIAGVAINVAGLLTMAGVFLTSTPIPMQVGRTAVGVLMTSPTFILFLLAYIVVQFGNNVASAAYSGVIPDLVPEDQRGAASGYMALMSQLGTLFGAVGMGLLLGGATESMRYVVVSIVLVAVALVTILGIKETPLPSKPPPIAWGPYIRSLWIDPKKYPDFAWVWITRALVMLGFYSVLPFLNYYFVDVIGIEHPEGTFAILSAVILIASSVSGILGGYISDRIGRKRVVYLANGMIAVMALVFIVCRNVEQVLAAGFLFGLGFGAYTSVDWALGTDVLPSKKDAAKEMAVWHVAMTLPQSVAAPIAGLLIAGFGKTVIHGVPAAAAGASADAVRAMLADGTGAAVAVMEVPETIVHYTVAGYSAVFVLCAVCFSLGAYLLRNVRGVK